MLRAIAHSAKSDPMFASSLGIEPDSLLNGRNRYRRLDRLPSEAGIVPRSCVLCSQLRIRQRVFFRMLGERIKLQAEKGYARTGLSEP